jgi:hypothetical protein
MKTNALKPLALGAETYFRSDAIRAFACQEGSFCLLAPFDRFWYVTLLAPCFWPLALSGDTYFRSDAIRALACQEGSFCLLAPFYRFWYAAFSTP